MHEVINVDQIVKDETKMSTEKIPIGSSEIIESFLYLGSGTNLPE